MDYFKIYDTLNSTNKEAQRLLAQGAGINGLTLFAKHQTDGMGQLGRAWISAPDSHMAMSIILQPISLAAAELPALSMKISLGIVNALTSIDPSIKPLIKWPNDIYVGNKKLCGILIENSLSGVRVQHAIIGIGMNVNEDQFPAEIPNAVSLWMLTGRKYEPQIIALIIRKHVLSILEDSSAEWKADYDLHIFGTGKKFEFLSDETKFEAEVIGISPDGHLILKNDSGENKSYASHEVKWVVEGFIGL